VLETLSDPEQAAIAREYERKSGRPFQCLPCLQSARPRVTEGEEHANEPAREVVAILELPEGRTPVCEMCYARFRDAGGIT
jgi:hypothetical protein